MSRKRPPRAREWWECKGKEMDRRFRLLLEEIQARYRHLPTSADEFAARKEEEKELEGSERP